MGLGRGEWGAGLALDPPRFINFCPCWRLGLSCPGGRSLAPWLRRAGVAGALCCQSEERGGSLRGAGPVCRGAGEGSPGSRDVCLRNCQSLWSLSVHLVGRLASGPVGVVPRSPGGVPCSPGTPGVLGGLGGGDTRPRGSAMPAARGRPAPAVPAGCQGARLCAGDAGEGDT